LEASSSFRMTRVRGNPTSYVTTNVIARSVPQ
jgi:hypothetical protein